MAGYSPWACKESDMTEQLSIYIHTYIHTCIHTKRIAYLGINLPKEARVLYSENYKTLMKEIEDDSNKWKDILCS